jgi:putative transcriptional regulator
MAKEAVIEVVLKTLHSAGYRNYVPLEKRSCFDVAARKEDSLLLVKVLENIDSLRESQAVELRTVSCSLGAIPLVVGAKSKSYELQEGAVYERYEILTVNPETFMDVLLRNESPERMFFRGRFVARIDSKALRERMESEDVTASEVAKVLKVTKEAVYQYEQGSSRIEFERARKLESLLGTDLIEGIDLFRPAVPCEAEKINGYLRNMVDIGFEVTPVRRGFDAIAREQRETLVLGHERVPSYAGKKAGFMKSVGEFFEGHPTFVLEKKQTRDSIKGVPVVRRSELDDMEHADEFMKLVKKREERQ